jgi:hypothetical protein
MAPANNNAKAKAEPEKEALRNQRIANERKKNENETKKSTTTRTLNRNTLVRNLANLKEPALDPLRDAIMSLSDPSFLNKKFNEDVYRGLPLRVKDFIGLSANQVTRAVIISKIIEAVKIAKNRNVKDKEESKKVNQIIGNALEKVVPKNQRAATTTNSAWMVNKKTSKNAGTITNTTENFKQGPEKAASGQPKRLNTQAVATTTNTGTIGVNVATQANNLTNKIANLQAQLEQAKANAAVAAAEQKAEANAKVTELTNELEQVKTNLVRERNEAEKAVTSLRKELQNASNAEKTNLTRKLENAEAALNLKTKVIALTRARAAVSKNKLRSELSKLQKNKDKLSKELQNKINQLAARNSSNEEIKQVAEERNLALNGLEKYSKTLANVMKNKKLNANTISDLQRRLTELQGISNVTRNQLSAQIKQLEQNRNAAVALVKQLQANKNSLSKNLQGQIANLQGQLAGSTNVTKTLAERVANLTTKKAKALAELQKAKTNLATTRSKLNDKNKNLINIKSQLEVREGEINTLKNVSKQLKNNLLIQVQEAKAITEKMIREKEEAEERARKFAALMKKFSKELMPKISSATLQNINTLNLSEYNNIEPDVKAAINKRKVELYRNELTKRTTNLAKLRAKLAQIPSGTEGKQNLSTKINAEEERRKRVAPALNFRKKINTNLTRTNISGIKPDIVKFKNKLPQNDDLLFKKLTTYEDNYREIFGKPKKFIFFNKVPAIGNGIFKASNMTIPNIKTFQLGAMGNTFTKQLQQNFATINSSFGDNPINVFFVGPSGSGKTTLFKDYTGSTNLKNLSGITVYKPTLTYDMNQGILYFSDEVIPNYDYSTFARQFIRPTPFNPQSSRAHMSIMSGEKNGEKNGEKRRVFDLAGKESPVAISELALGFNVFDGNYWILERTRLIDFFVAAKGRRNPIPNEKMLKLLTDLGFYISKSPPAGKTTDQQKNDWLKLERVRQVNQISELDEIIILFIYGNFISGNDRGLFGGLINKIKQPIEDYLSKWTFGKGKNQPEFGFEMFKHILKLDPSAKLSDYFSRINTKSDLIDLKFISEYDSYKANIVKEFELSKNTPKDLKGNTTVVRYIFEMMQRVFEGVYITRSLFSLKFLFDPSKKNISKNLVEEFTISGINENMRFGMKVKKCRPDLPNKVTCLFTAKGKNKEPLYTQTQKNIKNNKAKNNFVVLPLSTSEFKYYTSFYKDIKDKNFKNCLIGVISDFETLSSKVKQQRQSLEFFKKI